MHDGYQKKPIGSTRTIKSFIVNNFLFDNHLGLQGNLSSKRIIEDLKNDIKNEEVSAMKTPKVDVNREVATFEYKSELSGLKVCHKLNILTSIEDQDLLSWRTCFYEVSRICRWPEEAKLEVLTQIVDLSIQHKIVTFIDSNEMMNKILRLKYNQNTAHIFQSRLSNIQQTNFYSIRAFVNEIRDNCNKIGICLGWNDVMVNAKIEETFFTGLHEKVKFELVRCSDKSFDNCFRILSEMDQLCNENIISLFLKLDDEHLRLRKYESRNNNTMGKHKKDRPEYTSRTQERSRRFCHVHNSTSHSDSECRTQTKGNKSYKDMNPNKTSQKHDDKERRNDSNNIKNNKEHRTYAVREPNIKPKILEILLKINGCELKAMIDTGSVENFIPSSVISKYCLPVTELDKKKIVEVANGSEVEISRQCNLQFEILNDRNVTYKTTFMVMPTTTEILILGMKFLMDNDAVINLKEGTMNLDGIDYEIFEGSNNNNEFDSELINKLKICSIRNAMDNLIQTAKKKNPSLGKINVVEHKIEVYEDFKNIQKEYPVPVGLREEVCEHLQTLIEKDVIEEKHCEVSSPAFIIKKKNGKIRLVVDYRKLNAITIKTHQVTPNIYEILARLKGSNLFSVIDLNQGYYQIKIAKEDRIKTSFRIMNKNYVFKRMPFGLCNAPATFQTAMNIIFSNVNNVIIYIDDILVFTESEERHYQVLKEVFKLLHFNEVLINFEKSSFAQREVEFLGHKINKEGITPILTKIEAYENITIKTKKQLQKLLGFINWFRPFIPNLSILLSQLYDKLKETGRNIQMNESDYKVIKEIFLKIRDRGILHHPQLNEEFTLRCDASDKGLGSILLQKGKIIGYYSKKYNQQKKITRQLRRKYWQ
ncbi:Retrovirus-related Pol polyprotein from transposon 17.6 [Dictyocoela roeselum]|nr:Retrovirus-related Pol polyprotein from transposon 17.6 [Dictyocoela roeselum]